MRHLRHCLTAAILLAALAAPASAAIGGGDLIGDVRLAVGIAPGYDLDDGRDDTDAAARIGIQYFTNIFGGWRDWGGWVGGGEFSINPSSGHGVDVLTGAFTAFAGYAKQIPDHEQLHIEATPFFGIGVTSVDGNGAKDNNTYSEFGLRVAGFWTFENKWQVGPDIRFLSGQSVDNDWKNRGIVFSAVGGYRF